MTIQDKLERIQEEIKDRNFPKNDSTGLLVDMLVQVKKNSDDIKKRALDKSFVYGNIELLHNRTLKKMFSKDPELEAMVVKRRVDDRGNAKKKRSAGRVKRYTEKGTRRS